MKWNSIRTKVSVAFIACLLVILCGMVALTQYSFERNSQVLAGEAINGAQKLFAVLEAREVSKMLAVSDTLIANPEMRQALAAGERDRLLQMNSGLYSQLQQQGITNWMFHTAAPGLPVLLRLHNPAKFGDQLGRYLDWEVLRRHDTVSGNELAKAGFALRILRPVAGPDGKVVGYVEFGEELGNFIHSMKQQTGNDYGLLLRKSMVNRQMWADWNAARKTRDTWDDNRDVVLADKTTTSDAILQFNGDFTSLPEQGKVVERYQQGRSVFVRGMFPIHDAAGQNVGVMFVVRDISDFYLAMRRVQSLLVMVTVAALLLVMLVVLSLLNRFVFRRLKHIIRVATKVVGGDYTSEIELDSDDEVGELELLFEQFRRVFVDLLKQLYDGHEDEQQVSSPEPTVAAS